MALKLLDGFTDVLGEPEEICDSQPLSLSPDENYQRHHSNDSGRALALQVATDFDPGPKPKPRPAKGTGQHGVFRSAEEIDIKYRNVFSYPFFNLVQSRVIDDALYSDKSMVVCAPTGSGKTVVFEMAIVQLLMDLEDKNETHDFKIIYMAPVKALCTERLTEWYAKFTKLGLLCIEVTGDTDVDFTQLKPYRIIITTPEKWDMLTRRWRDHRQLVEVIKLFLIDEVHILNDNTRGPVLEAVVSRMKTIESSVQSTHRIEQLQQQYQGSASASTISAPNIRFIAVSATVGNPEDVAAWLGTQGKPAVYYKFGDECRPVKLKRVVEGYHCAEGSSIFKFDLILNYKLWPIIQKYHNGKPTLIFCNTRKSVVLTAETVAREITITFNEEQKARLNALASTIKTKKLQTLVLSGVGCHHAGLLYEERTNIEQAFRNRDLPILITTTTLAMGVNLPAHLVIVKNTQQYVNGAYQEYSISTILQMVGRAGRPQFDTEATAVIMTRSVDKPRYQALVGGSEPLQSYLHKRLPENLNSEAALGTVSDVAQCVQWLRSTFLSVRAAKDPKRYLGLPPKAPSNQISTKIEELCVKAMNGLATAGLISMDDASCIESTEAGRLMSIYYIDLETMKHIMKIDGSESLERLLWIVCECHELADMHLRMDERRCLNTLNRNNTGSTIRFPMKGKITTRQMKLNCVIQASLGCLTIPDPSLNQEATKIMRIADRVCKCLVAYVTRPALISQQPKFYSAVLNSIILRKCIVATLWENSPYVCKQLRGIGPTFSTLLATAGKSNFMLLEESHPRDLERIMNKGPPAGNIIRKQINLLPKYQLTATPVDEKVVSIELKLLNHHNLAENMDNLTAGPTHKSYIIIGDSENTLLLLSSFKETDLISVYDGAITFQVTRIYEFEHKIYTHCVSSTIAGIDASCEYLFKDIEPLIHQQPNFNEDAVVHKQPKRQTTITDTFRERKRKNTDNEIAHSKEKKKRENSMFEKFKNLKQSFCKTSKILKDDLEKSSVMSKKILQDLTHLEHPVKQNIAVTSENITSVENYDKDNQLVKSTFFEEPKTYEIHDDDFTYDYVDDDNINKILCEIECEISKENKIIIPDRTKLFNQQNDSTQKTIASKPACVKSISNRNSYPNADSYKTINYNTKRIKNIPKKSNFSFIEKLEKNEHLSEGEESKIKEQNGFSDDAITHIEKYLLKAKSNAKTSDRVLNNLLYDEPIPKDTKETDSIIIVEDSVTEKDTTLDQTVLLELTNNETENSFIYKHEVSEMDQIMRSIDLTNNDIIIDCHTQEFYNEQELPAVDLGKKKSVAEKEDDSNTKQINMNKEENHCEVYNEVIESHNEAVSVLIPKSNNSIDLTNNDMIIDFHTKEFYDEQELPAVDLGEKKSVAEKTDHSNTEQININKEELYNDAVSVLIPKSNNTESIHDHLNYEPKTKKPKLLSEIWKTSLVPWVAPSIDVINKNYLPKENDSVIAFQNTEFSSSSVEDYQGNTKIERSILMETSDSENCVTGIEIPPKVNVIVPKPHTSQLNKKQEFPVLELWKNYIKELTPLEINEVKMNDGNDNASDNENTSTEVKLLSNSLNNSNQLLEVKENLRLQAINSNKKGIFIPPFKHNNTGTFEKLESSSQLVSKNKETVSFALKDQIATQSAMENITNGNFMREATKLFIPTSTSDYSLPSLKHSNELTSAIESNRSMADNLETNRSKDNIEVTTCNDIASYDSQALHTQQNCSQPQSVISTVNHVINTEKQLNLPNLTTLNNQQTKTENLLSYPEHLQFTQQNCDDNMPRTSKILEKQQAAENEPFNEWDDNVTINKNTTICAISDQVSSQKNNEHYSKDNFRKHYINQYSFSTNKIGVSTQETADHVVRVVRRLRIDLDVTEIISGAGKKGNSETSKILDDSTKLATVPNVETFNLRETKPYYVSTILGEVERPFVTKCNQIKYLNKGSKDDVGEESKRDGNENEPDCNTSLSVAENKPLENETIKEIEKRKDDSLIEEDKIEKTIVSEYKMDDIQVEKKPNSVESILQKYSYLMRLRNSETIDCSQSQVKEKCPVGLKKDKPNRPFKISDIHRLNPSPLPEVLIENPKAINVTECFNQLNPNDKQAKLEENMLFNICETLPRHKILEEEYFSPKDLTGQSAIEDLPDFNTPYIDSLEEKDTVSDMEQNMFNPKALLQCFRKHTPEDKAFIPEYFIPPPPEFSDHLNEPNTTHISLPTDCYEPVTWEESVSRQEIPKTSIFLDSQAELTPSKEIETWNLSQDEGRQIHAFPGTSPYSFTMMHKQSLETPSKAVETWSLSQEDKEQDKMYGTPGLNPYSFTIMRKNEHGGKRIFESVEQSQTQPRNLKLKAFQFIRRNKYM